MDLARLQAAASAGDAEARAELIRLYYGRVRDMVHRELELDFRRHHRWILPLFSTGDVVQEVFTAVVRGLDSFEAEDETAFVRYLATLVKHRLVDAVRHHEAACRDGRRHAQGDDEAVDEQRAAGAMVTDDPTPSIAASLAEQLRTFREVLDTFPERERALLELRLVEDVQFAALAGRLGYPSADAARKAFRKVQARLLVRLRARGLSAPGPVPADEDATRRGAGP